MLTINISIGHIIDIFKQKGHKSSAVAEQCSKSTSLPAHISVERHKNIIQSGCKSYALIISETQVHVAFTPEKPLQGWGKHSNKEITCIYTKALYILIFLGLQKYFCLDRIFYLYEKFALYQMHWIVWSGFLFIMILH